MLFAGGINGLILPVRGMVEGLSPISPGLLADLSSLLLAPRERMLNLILAALLGEPVYAMYPVIMPHANHHAAPGTAIQISGGLLLRFGIGPIIGPGVAGWAIAAIGIRALFVITACTPGMAIVYTLWRITKCAAVAEAAITRQKGAPRGTRLFNQTDRPGYFTVMRPSV